MNLKTPISLLHHLIYLPLPVPAWACHPRACIKEWNAPSDEFIQA